MSNAQPATGSQPDEIGDKIRSEIGSILLAGTDPDALRTWYERAFGVTTDVDGFLRFGSVDLLITGRHDVAARNPEPGRLIINIHVHDARSSFRGSISSNSGAVLAAPTPMLARLEACLPVGDQSRYEPKLDGFRGLLWRSSDDTVRRLSRNMRDLTAWFPELVRAANAFA